jgi:hypothetical protein
MNSTAEGTQINLRSWKNSRALLYLFSYHFVSFKLLQTAKRATTVTTPRQYCHNTTTSVIPQQQQQQHHHINTTTTTTTTPPRQYCYDVYQLLIRCASPTYLSHATTGGPTGDLRIPAQRSFGNPPPCIESLASCPKHRIRL